MNNVAVPVYGTEPCNKAWLVVNLLVRRFIPHKTIKGGRPIWPASLNGAAERN